MQQAAASRDEARSPAISDTCHFKLSEERPTTLRIEDSPWSVAFDVFLAWCWHGVLQFSCSVYGRAPARAKQLVQGARAESCTPTCAHDMFAADFPQEEQPGRAVRHLPCPVLATSRVSKAVCDSFHVS